MNVLSLFRRKKSAKAEKDDNVETEVKASNKLRVEVEFKSHWTNHLFGPEELIVFVTDEELARIIEKWRYPSGLCHSVKPEYSHIYDDLDRCIYLRIEEALEERMKNSGWDKTRDSFNIYWPQEEVDRLGIGMTPEEFQEKRNTIAKIAAEATLMAPRSIMIEGVEITLDNLYGYIRCESYWDDVPQDPDYSPNYVSLTEVFNIDGEGNPPIPEKEPVKDWGYHEITSYSNVLSVYYFDQDGEKKCVKTEKWKVMTTLVSLRCMIYSIRQGKEKANNRYALKLSIGYRTNYGSNWLVGDKYEEPKYAGQQEYTVMLCNEEMETVRLGMLGSESYNFKDINPSHRNPIEKDVKSVLDRELDMDCDPFLIKIVWAKGERERLLHDIRYLTEDDVRLMKSRVEENGEGITRAGLLEGLENCCVRKEVWTRETGHMWEKYTLLERIPSQDERDFADTWDVYPVRLTNFATETIIKMLKS